jgi:hypothetical protein
LRLLVALRPEMFIMMEVGAKDGKRPTSVGGAMNGDGVVFSQQVFVKLNFRWRAHGRLFSSVDRVEDGTLSGVFLEGCLIVEVVRIRMRVDALTG